MSSKGNRRSRDETSYNLCVLAIRCPSSDRVSSHMIPHFGTKLMALTDSKAVFCPPGLTAPSPLQRSVSSANSSTSFLACSRYTYGLLDLRTLFFNARRLRTGGNCTVSVYVLFLELASWRNMQFHRTQLSADLDDHSNLGFRPRLLCRPSVMPT